MLTIYLGCVTTIRSWRNVPTLVKRRSCDNQMCSWLSHEGSLCNSAITHRHHALYSGGRCYPRLRHWLPPHIPGSGGGGATVQPHTDTMFPMVRHVCRLSNGPIRLPCFQWSDLFAVFPMVRYTFAVFSMVPFVVKCAGGFRPLKYRPMTRLDIMNMAPFLRGYLLLEMME